MNASNNEVLDQAEAAFYLKVKPRTLRLWRTRRGLPFLRITGKHVLFRRTDLDKWLDQHRTAITA